MSIDKELRDFMLGDLPINTIVAGRIFPIELPEQTVLPAIAFQQISSPRDHTLDAVPTMAQPRWQITSFARTAIEAKALADAVEAAFDGSIGALVVGSAVQLVLVLDRHDLFDGAARTYMSPVDVQLIFNPGGDAMRHWQKYTFGSGLTGAINGVNQDFTLPVKPDALDMIVVYNGVVLTSDRYTVTNQTITLDFAPNPASDVPADTLEVYA